MRQLKVDLASRMPRKEAIATLSYFCKISETDFAVQLAKKNPQWGLRVVGGVVKQQR